MQRLRRRRCSEPHSRSRFVCTSCGTMFDADVNAAKNILSIGITPTGGPSGMACESSRTAGRKQEEDAREGGSSAFRAESSHQRTRRNQGQGCFCGTRKLCEAQGQTTTPKR
ncbi:transposase [Bradyrhizobium tropiciagri]|uniref:zinc ribbon domain-containing protein n=1 Tax=Bradyrhizobium tropiciagri TaxID=312253 RepID=UPI001BA7CC47|nr:transposase [Bradyrhizobium tropiciagri]